MYKNNILELSFINSNNNVRITFNEKEKNEVGFIVNDFRELGLQWLDYCGNNKIEKCEICNRRIVKTTNIKKYCKQCGINIKKEKDRVRSEENRKNRK